MNEGNLGTDMASHVPTDLGYPWGTQANTNEQINIEKSDTMNGKASIGIFLILLASVCWGVMGVFVRNLTDFGYSSFDISFLRCAIATLLYATYVRITNPKALRSTKRGILTGMVYGMLTYSLSFFMYSTAVQRLPISVATVLMFTSPIWVALLSRLVFGERIGFAKVLAIGVCLLGACLVSGLLGETQLQLDVLGILAGCINAVGAAGMVLIPAYFSDRYENDTLLVYGFAGATLALTTMTNFPHILETLTGTQALPVLGSILGIALPCTVVANVAYVKSAAYISPTTTSILAALEVVVGSLVGVWLFQEHMRPWQIVGSVLIVLAAAFVATHKDAKQNTPDPSPMP